MMSHHPELPALRSGRFRLARLELEDWGPFARADCPLGERTFLAGPHGAGKSVLFEALRFLRDLASPGWGLAAASRSPERRRLLRIPGRRPSLGVEIRTPEDGRRVLYRLELEGRGSAPPVILREELSIAADTPGTAGPSKTETETETEGGLPRPPADGASAEVTGLERLAARRLPPGWVRWLAGLRLRSGVSTAPVLPPGSPDAPVNLWGTGRERDPARAGRPLLAESSEWHELLRPVAVGERRAREEAITAALRPFVPGLRAIELEDRSWGGPGGILGRFEKGLTALPASAERLVLLAWECLGGADAAEGPLLLDEPELVLPDEARRWLPEFLARLEGSRQLLAATHVRRWIKRPLGRPRSGDGWTRLEVRKGKGPAEVVRLAGED